MPASLNTTSSLLVDMASLPNSLLLKIPPNRCFADAQTTLAINSALCGAMALILSLGEQYNRRLLSSYFRPKIRRKRHRRWFLVIAFSCRHGRRPRQSSDRINDTGPCTCLSEERHQSLLRVSVKGTHGPDLRCCLCSLRGEYIPPLDPLSGRLDNLSLADCTQLEAGFVLRIHVLQDLDKVISLSIEVGHRLSNPQISHVLGPVGSGRILERNGL